MPVMAVGTGVMGGMPVPAISRILHRAFELGATWWDTSDDYGTEPAVGSVLADFPRENVIISTKTYAASRDDALISVELALKQLRTRYIDMLFLHHVRDVDDYQRRQDALQVYHELKEQGIIRAVGLSSHVAAPIRLAAGNPRIDVVLAPWNAFGQLPEGGAPIAMEDAIRVCYHAGQGVVLMKLLAAGVLRADQDEVIPAAMRFHDKHAVNIGIRSIMELETDIRLVNGWPVDASILEHLKRGESGLGEAA